jgi:hypothetical protein
MVQGSHPVVAYLPCHQGDQILRISVFGRLFTLSSFYETLCTEVAQIFSTAKNYVLNLTQKRVGQHPGRFFHKLNLVTLLATYIRSPEPYRGLFLISPLSPRALGGILTLLFTPRVEHSLLFRRMEGQRDNFTPRGQNLPLGGQLRPWGQSLLLWEKITMVLTIRHILVK